MSLGPHPGTLIPHLESARTERLAELDALRGIAATMVMFFHFTTQYDRLFGHVIPPAVSLPWGHYGVNLFFMISGFVIFLTLHRVRRPMDFVVSRFSRLFPAFWAAVLTTFLLTHALGLPGKTVGMETAALNLLMIHGLFRVPHVDGVYWTLEIELIFYFWALILYQLGRLDRVHGVLLVLLGLRLAYFLGSRLYGIDFSYTVSRLLILPFIPWFCCGIMIYRRTYLRNISPRRDLFLLAIAIGVLALVDGPAIGLLALLLCFLLGAAARGRLPVLANPILVWLGTISYTLYLVHENIGWGVILQAQHAGVGTNVSIALAVAVALVLATALTRVVEQPVMQLLRQRYRRYKSASSAFN